MSAFYVAYSELPRKLLYLNFFSGIDIKLWERNLGYYEMSHLKRENSHTILKG